MSNLKQITEGVFQFPDQKIPFYSHVYFDPASKGAVVISEQPTDVSDNDFLSTRENRVRESTNNFLLKFGVRQEYIQHVDRDKQGVFSLLETNVSEQSVTVSVKGAVAKEAIEQHINRTVKPPTNTYGFLKMLDSTIKKESEVALSLFPRERSV
jgi:hypothetical protein